MIAQRNQIEFQEKLQTEMERYGFDALVLTNAESIFYATGYASRYAYNGQMGNTVAVLPKTGGACVICAQFEAKTAQECPDIEVVTYPIWLYIADFPDEGEKPIQPDPNKVFKLAVDVLQGKMALAKKIGVDSGFLPYERMDYLSSVYGRENISDCARVFVAARLHKTAWEIELMRENSKMAEREFYETARLVEPGMTEEDIMHIFAIKGYEQDKGVYGVRHAHSHGAYYAPAYIPRRHQLVEGDIIRLDGGIMRQGYITDLGRSFVVGKKLAPERAAIYETLLSAYDIGLEMMGPGVSPAEMFRRMLARVQKDMPEFKRAHFGHSTGCVRGEEAPFIAESFVGTFEPGMIFCMETPYYSSKDGSYNIEDTFLITEDGYEQFTHANRTLFWPER